MADSETVKVVLRKTDLAPGLKTIDVKSLREVLAKAQNKQQLQTEKPTKKPAVRNQFNSPEGVFIKQEPVSPAKKVTPQRVVSIKPGTWTKPHVTPAKRVSFGQDLTPRKPKAVKADDPEFSCCFCDFSSFNADKYRRHVSTHVRTKTFRCTTCNFVTSSIADYNNHIADHKRSPIGPLYGCNVCDFKALTPQALIKHKASLKHNKLKDKPPMKCKICGFADNDVYKVALHITSHDQSEVIDCEKCNYPSSVARHNPKCPEIANPPPFACDDVVLRPRKRKFACTLCEFESDEILFLMEHIKAHARSRSSEDEDFDGDMPFCCTMCEFRCVRPAKLVEHMKSHGPGTVFCCKECNFDSKDMDAFKAHWKSHSVKTGAFKCFVCLKTYSSSAELSDHMIVHSKGKPFACNICQYQCLTKQRLLVHLKSHANKKTQVFFPCPLCSNKYSTSGSLRQHLQTHNTGRTGPVKCDKCDYTCVNNDLLKLHMKLHELKFRCEICRRAFSTEESLKSHVLDHVTLMTPMVCGICDQTFPSKALLANHQADQHSKPVSCEICSADFIDEKDLTAHMAEHEGGGAMDVDQEDQASRNESDPQENAVWVEEQVYGESASEDDAVQEGQQHLGYPMVTE